MDGNSYDMMDVIESVTQSENINMFKEEDGKSQRTLIILKMKNWKDSSG